MKPENIYAAFKKAGILPYDRHIFKEEDFLPSSVTDRPVPGDNNIQQTNELPNMCNAEFSQASSSLHDYNVEISDNNPSRISNSDIMQISTGKQLSPTIKAFISPEEVRGFP
ncbi:hypothetical protein QE152_g23406 [Popillia japonica]|uniref:Uncharacterized protein n=1 Tax=Popillia japonica TaxID=7064 RepID=A0AAW1KH82_POPJA